MLKWTVGQRTSIGERPAGAIANVEICRNKIQAASAAKRRVRRDKENPRRRRNSENDSVKRRRSSRNFLDDAAVPLALRDVSNDNFLRSPPTCDDGKENFAKNSKNNHYVSRRSQQLFVDYSHGADKNCDQRSEERQSPLTTMVADRPETNELILRAFSHLTTPLIREKLTGQRKNAAAASRYGHDVLPSGANGATAITIPSLSEEPVELFHKALPKSGRKKGKIGCDFNEGARWMREIRYLERPEAKAKCSESRGNSSGIFETGENSFMPETPVVETDTPLAGTPAPCSAETPRKRKSAEELDYDYKRRCIVFDDLDEFWLPVREESTLRRQKGVRRKKKRKAIGRENEPGVDSSSNLGGKTDVRNDIFEGKRESGKDYLRGNDGGGGGGGADAEFRASNEGGSDCSDVFTSPVQPWTDFLLSSCPEESDKIEKATEVTWNSHKKPDGRRSTFLTSSQTQVSPSSSKFNYDQEMPSSIVSATSQRDEEFEERHIRRKLSFTSPKTTKIISAKSQARNRNQGQLNLEIYFENGFIVVYIKNAKNLQPSDSDKNCNAYIKVNLVPKGRNCHRTCVRRNFRNPKFDKKFLIEITENDLNKRVLISAWHRDRGQQKSEFLGSMSFAVKNVLKKEINGCYKLSAQNSKQLQNSQSRDAMTNVSGSSTEDKCSPRKTDKTPSIDLADSDKLKLTTITRKESDKGFEECLFLRHLELDPSEVENPKGGRTPFTTTHKLVRKSGSGYGFSIAWTHPPRVERVEENLPADLAGLRPGDNVVFVNKTNVVTLNEGEILDIIKNGGNILNLEIYRRVRNNSNSVVRRSLPACAMDAFAPSCSIGRSDSIVTASLAPSMDANSNRRSLQLPHLAFSTESKPDEENASPASLFRELCQKEEKYALCLQFGIGRFLLPLAERKDVLRPSDHQTLFQNIQEILRITEDISEQLSMEEKFSNVPKIYSKKLPFIKTAYVKYCCGLKKADCILVEKTTSSEFMELMRNPPIPKNRPDFVTFIHKPLDHYRDILKLLQMLGKQKTVFAEYDYKILAKLISDLQITYKDITRESGLMEPGNEGRPLLTIQDLESRLVFTKCKPFKLTNGSRKWIFGGDLLLLEGRTSRPFWVLLFSDMLLFTKISRDRVVFVTCEPLPLDTIASTRFDMKKRPTDFKLSIGPRRFFPCSSSPATGCVPSMAKPKSPAPDKRSIRKRTIILRAQSPELKAVWQNLIQKQIIKINTAGEGVTPLSEAATDQQRPDSSVATIDNSTCATFKQHQCDMIEHKCRGLSKSSSITKGGAYHLEKWMKGELNGNRDQEGGWDEELEPEPEIWSRDDLRRRSNVLQNNTRQFTDDEVEIVYLESVVESPSNPSESVLSPTRLTLCRECHKTCLQERTIGMQIRDSKSPEKESESEKDLPPTVICVTPPDDNELLNSNNLSPLKRYASTSNLNEINGDAETGESTANVKESYLTWASSFVSKKVSLFGSLETGSFIEKYLKPSSSPFAFGDRELPSTSQTLQLMAFEEDAGSGGTSGDEFWATPTSGDTSPNSLEQRLAISPDSLEEGGFERLLGASQNTMPPLVTPNRILQNKSRLETLPEDEEDLASEMSSSCTSGKTGNICQNGKVSNDVSVVVAEDGKIGIAKNKHSKILNIFRKSSSEDKPPSDAEKTKKEKSFWNLKGRRKTMN